MELRLVLVVVLILVLARRCITLDLHRSRLHRLVAMEAVVGVAVAVGVTVELVGMDMELDTVQDEEMLSAEAVTTTVTSTAMRKACCTRTQTCIHDTTVSSELILPLSLPTMLPPITTNIYKLTQSSPMVQSVETPARFKWVEMANPCL